MVHILITGLYLAAASTSITALGFQPTNNLTVSKINRVGWRTTTTTTTTIAPSAPPGGWDAPPPAPPGGWPAIPPPPVGWPAPPPPPVGWPADTLIPDEPPPNDCTDPGTPVAECPSQDDLAQSAYVASTNCECFFQCSNGVPISQPCLFGLYFNPSLNVCDYPEDSGCTLNFDIDITVTDGKKIAKTM